MEKKMNDIIKNYLNNKLIITLFFIGIFLILVSGFNKSTRTVTESEPTDQEYILNLESRIESIISAIEGIVLSHVIVTESNVSFSGTSYSFRH